jgi:N,N'-diacetyllegionaminate synthase
MIPQMIWSKELKRHPAFVIAEAGVNHNGSLKMALELVDAAAEARADAVKFQLFNASEQISRYSPTAAYQQSATGEKSMLEMAKTYDLPWEAHEQISQHCKSVGIMYMSSCFDAKSVHFYHQIGGEILKIASGEITNTELLKVAAESGLPIILSTGMSSIGEISDAVNHIRKSANPPLALLHCVSRYPTPLDALNLNFIKTLSAVFNLPVGLSDHTNHLGVGGWAVVCGASIIEKHMTLDQNLSGPDHAMSSTPEDMKRYIQQIREVESALGNSEKLISQEEIEVRDVARRSIVAARDLPKGTKLTPDDLALKRPGNGISPLFKHLLLGRELNKMLSADQQIAWEDL